MEKIAQELFYTLNKETNNSKWNVYIVLNDSKWNNYIVLNDGWYIDKFTCPSDEQAIQIFYRDYINKK